MTTITNKDGIEFDIDAIATDLNGKMDRDGVNAIPSETFISMFMPDYNQKVSWATGIGNIWEAPYDCYLSILLDQNSSFGLRENSASGSRFIYYYTVSSNAITTYIPIKKSFKGYVSELSLSGQSKIYILPITGTNQ